MSKLSKVDFERRISRLKGELSKVQTSINLFNEIKYHLTGRACELVYNQTASSVKLLHQYRKELKLKLKTLNEAMPNE